MAFSLNKIMVVGNLGQDAEHRFTTNNTEITSFSIATTHSYKKDNDWVNETTWHNITVFGASDFLKSKLVKGAKFYVEGRLNKREYEKDGQKRLSVDIIADKFNIIPLDSEGNDKPENKTELTNSDTDEGDDLPF